MRRGRSGASRLVRAIGLDPDSSLSVEWLAVSGVPIMRGEPIAGFDHIEIADGFVSIAGASVAELAAKYGTPYM